MRRLFVFSEVEVRLRFGSVDQAAEGRKRREKLKKRYPVLGRERSSWETRSQRGATARRQVHNWLLLLLSQSLQ